MRKIVFGSVAVSVALLSGCGKQEEATVVAAPASAPASAPAAPVAAARPDFGGITKVSREVDAVGSTQELAVLAALQMAVAQVNGVRVASEMQSVRAELDLSINGQSAGYVRGEAFMKKVVGASKGAVTGFEILSQEEIDKIDEQTVSRVRASDAGYSYSASASSDNSVDMRHSGSAHLQAGDASARGSHSFAGSATSSESASVDVKRGPSSFESDATYTKMRSYWKVRLKVDVAQYRAPEEEGRPKIVVAMPRTLTGQYPVGDATVTSSDVARAVRGRLSDILTQTKRFIVLDREFGQEMQSEIDHINSGNVRVQDAARLGQQLATDLVLIPTIERFEYPRRVQKLRMSDRELVSYSGGGRITLRLLNAATGEVVLSDSFEHQLAAADPSTMPRVVDGQNMAAEMMQSLSARIGGAIVTEIFPVAVVAMTGDQAVLTQGGEALQVGQRWRAVALGEALKDPQTGQSLGHHEAPVGILRIDRVSSKTSYGTFEDGAPNLNGQSFRSGGIVLREQVAPPKAAAAAAQKVAIAEPSPAAPIAPTRPAGRPARAETAEVTVAPPAPAAPKDDNKNW